QLQEAQDLNSDDLDTPEDRSLVEEVCAAFENYLCNGGGWILNRTQKESAELFLLIRQHQYTTRKQNPRQYEERLRDIRKGISNLIEKNPDPFHFLISGITRYEDYFNALPYVIRIEDEANPAWVVHADNPFNDEALDEKIGENIELTIEEIRDLAYTRPGFFSSARTQESIVTYCGHNIVDNQTVLPFRSSANAINLDTGAFCRNGFVVVNHSLHTAKMVAAPSISSKHAGELEMFAADINNYLEAMQLRSCNIGFSSRI
ncbi:MAG TPA: hypothetical protein DDY37_00360, partial [Legionella sp.]|nr:hypothetical protein [Legionella sp.]